MAGGWIQAGLLKSLSGKAGLPAWRWIFIIVSVMTIPVALFGMFHRVAFSGSRSPQLILFIMGTGWVFIPDLPVHRAAWYLNAEEKEHAARRLGATPRYTWDRSVFWRIFLSWQFYLLPFIFMRWFYLQRLSSNLTNSSNSSVLPLRAVSLEQRPAALDEISWLHDHPAE